MRHFVGYAMLASSVLCMAPEAGGVAGAGTPAPSTPGSSDATRPMTLGENRVGISFNPSNNGDVDNIKRRAADLIDAIAGSMNASSNSEANRCYALAMTAVEDAAMWAVKGLTKKA